MRIDQTRVYQLVYFVLIELKPRIRAIYLDLEGVNVHVIQLTLMSLSVLVPANRKH